MAPTCPTLRDMDHSLSPSIDAAQIHETALSIMADPGLRIEHDGIVERLLKAGAKPGHAAQVIRFPGEMVGEWIARTPATVRLANRAADAQVVGAGHPSRVWSTPGLRLWRDGVCRPFRSRDMAESTRLLDRLSEADGVFGMSMDDVPPASRDVTGLRIMAQNTRKHIRVLCFTPAGAERLTQMKPVVSDDPWFSIGFTAHGPLRWTRLALEVFEKTAGHGIPVSINGEPMAGVSGPVTLAGSAAVGHAEILAGIVINQLLEPGRPCLYNLGLAHVFDMRQAIAVTGGPENHLLAGTSAAMGRLCRIPSCSWVSTESMVPDAQAALEKSLGFLWHLQSGVNLVWGIGQLESELTFSPAQAAVDNEILRYVRRLLAGVRTDLETLAGGVIREVGIGGDYLTHDHTLDHFRELFEPELLFRQKREAWETMGRPDMAVRAEKRADTLSSASAEPCPTDDQDRELRAIEVRHQAAPP